MKVFLTPQRVTVVHEHNRLCGLAKFLLHPSHFSSTSHGILYSPFSQPLLIGQQVVCAKVSAIDRNWSKLIEQMKSHFFLI